MRTIYLVKSPSNNISFESHPELGLHFIESSVDIGFLNNVVIDRKLKILINQKSGQQWVGMGAVWFVLFDEKPLSNQSLEDSYVFIKNIGNQLFKVTKLGQSFSYKDIYAIPNVSDSWRIENIYIEYTENGGFKEIYCLDKSAPIEQDGDKTIYRADGKSVNADLVFVVGNDNQKIQAQFVHITIPSPNINVDASRLRITEDMSPLQHFHGVESYRSTKGLIFELYNTAITTGSVFTSYLLLFQIVEILISEGKSSTLSIDTISAILNQVRQADLADEVFITRLNGVLRGLKKESSIELLRSGVSVLVGPNSEGNLDYSDFPRWRNFRGKITHPMRTQELTDSEFTAQYKSIRKFVDALTYALP